MNVLYDLVLYAGYYPGWYIFLVTSVLVLSIYLVSIWYSMLVTYLVSFWYICRYAYTTTMYSVPLFSTPGWMGGSKYFGGIQLQFLLIPVLCT